MSPFANRCGMLVIGLFVAGIASVATPAAINVSADNGQVYDSSQDISEAQAILQYAGYLAPGTYREGEADTSTARALRTFQTAHGLPATGSIDYETTTQLLSHTEVFDRDGDGVADTLDRCPGTRPGVRVDAQGCPEETHHASLFEGRRRLVLEGVRFDNDTARLKPGSRMILDRVARSLNARPDVRVRIDGHTDSTNTEAYNLRLSKERSAAVCEYLVDRGVAPWRLKEKGFGESRPLADNSTADGRRINRRVEITRID